MSPHGNHEIDLDFAATGISPLLSPLLNIFPRITAFKSPYGANIRTNRMILLSDKIADYLFVQ